MTLNTKRTIISVLSIFFLLSLVFVQWMEVARKEVEAGMRKPVIHIPASSQDCVKCHKNTTAGIIAHWEGSTHARKGVGCVECHHAEEADVDGFSHYGQFIATRSGRAHV